MKPLFTKEQLNGMSKKNIIALMQTMQEHQQKQETEIRLLKEKAKELEFLNAMLSDRLTLAQRKQYGPSSEKYADGYTQLNLFNEAEQESDPEAGRDQELAHWTHAFRESLREGIHHNRGGQPHSG